MHACVHSSIFIIGQECGVGCNGCLQVNRNTLPTWIMFTGEFRVLARTMHPLGSRPPAREAELRHKNYTIFIVEHLIKRKERKKKRPKGLLDSTPFHKDLRQRTRVD